MKKINIYGASGHGKVVRDCILSEGNEVGIVYDDNPTILDFFSQEVKQPDGNIQDSETVVAIGDNKVRKNVVTVKKLVVSQAIIHRDAILSESVEIGRGTVIMPQVVVNADTQIGSHCIINTACIVEHDVSVDDFVHISPHATITGGVNIAEGAHIGAAAVVLPNICIGEWSIIGAGAVVTKDVPPHSVVVGNPAKIVK